MLQDESIEYIKEQYDDKNMVLSGYGEEVSAISMYEDIFGDVDITMPIVIISDDDNGVIKHIVPMPIYDAVEMAANRNDMLMGGCTYFNNWISKKSAKDIYTFIIDMDNVYSGTLMNALRQNWYTASGDYLPMPTYIVNSGTGLHLYFVLEEPIPNYKATTENLDKLYRALAIGQTTRRVYLKKQVQWFGQDFRIAGGLNKYDFQNKVYKVGDKWDIDELGKAVGLKDVHFIRYGEKRTKKKKPIRQNQKRKGWYSNRAWYDMALEQCRDKTNEGNRYMSMCALSVIAWKCRVPEAELEKDLYSLLPDYNKKSVRKVKEKEVLSALKMYNSKAMLTQRATLENWQGWDYKPIKRNGRKREVHLRIARANKEILKEVGEMKPEGRPTKKELIEEYRKKNPEASITEIAKALNISRTTVYKWCGNAKDNRPA